MKKKRPEKESHKLLDNQKLSSRKKSHKKKLFKILYIFVVLSLAILLSEKIKSLPEMPSLIRISSLQWDHEILGDSLKKSFKEKTFSDFKTIKHIAKQIQFESAASQVHFFRPQWDLVVIHYYFYKAVAGILLGSPRLINSDGKVFGTYEETKHSQLPLIKGIQILSELKTLEDSSLEISKANLHLIHEALLLIDLGMRYNITYRTIFFDPYRGFSGDLRGNRISVEMGRAPFEKRYKKLVKIKDALEKKNVQTARIELDFPGKAFIKEL